MASAAAALMIKESLGRFGSLTEKWTIRSVHVRRPIRMNEQQESRFQHRRHPTASEANFLLFLCNDILVPRPSPLPPRLDAVLYCNISDIIPEKIFYYNMVPAINPRMPFAIPRVIQCEPFMSAQQRISTFNFLFVEGNKTRISLNISTKHSIYFLLLSITSISISSGS